MEKGYNNTEMKTVNNEGFITSAFWDKSIHLMTIDEEGNSVDCYDKVVDDLKNREDKVVFHYKKEERKNKFINFVYDGQKKGLITSLVLTGITFVNYLVFVVYGSIDTLYKADAFVASKLHDAIYEKLCKLVAPTNNAVLNFINQYGLENLFNYTLGALAIVSIVSLLLFMVGRDHVTVRWATRILHIKPLCRIKADSDNKVNRLKSDLYKLQLRQHKVKYATHEK
ncbi:MAG: hypothetical protein E7262_05645 [Lachnospiraceae bacterium]|nr:hypothetical protein [Lachnospiraceae bacterium]